MADAGDRSPPVRDIKQKLPRSVLGKDFVVICISTYPRELKKLDALVAEAKRSGQRKASRSSLIRHAINKLCEGHAEALDGPDAAE